LRIIRGFLILKDQKFVNGHVLLQKGIKGKPPTYSKKSILYFPASEMD
jgi:hypothetical protein